MTAIEDAKTALSNFDQAGVDTVLTTVPAVVYTLRELIAEHERLTTPPSDDEREAPDKAIWSAVMSACCGYDGAEPHAVTWSRGGYRNDVPTLCDRCAALIETLKGLSGFRRRQGPITDEWEYGITWEPYVTGDGAGPQSYNGCDEALSAPVSDVLASHDRRVRAEALREAADAMRAIFNSRSTLGRTSDDWLRAEADRIEHTNP